MKTFYLCHECLAMFAEDAAAEGIKMYSGDSYAYFCSRVCADAHNEDIR